MFLFFLVEISEKNNYGSFFCYTGSKTNRINTLGVMRFRFSTNYNPKNEVWFSFFCIILELFKYGLLVALT